tara:strand:+ start:28786 stop:29247 length:462 start_codon:yes stop_codon:yes gene_type:complete
MDERKGSILLGLDTTLKISRFKLEVSIEQDIYDRHHGTKAQMFLGSGIPLSLFIDSIPFTLFKLSLGAGYYSAAYNNYYYGVKSSEVSLNRSAYKPGDSVSLLMKSSMMLKMTKELTLTFGFSRENQARKIKQSPIVTGKNIESFTVFLTYNL